MYQVYDHVLLAVKRTSVSVETNFKTIEKRTVRSADSDADKAKIWPSGTSDQMLFGSEFWFVLKWSGPSFGPWFPDLSKIFRTEGIYQTSTNVHH